MKKVLTGLLCTLLGSSAVFGQWTPTSAKVDTKQRSMDLKNVAVRGYYKLDVDFLKSQLKNAQESGANSKPVVVSIPTLDGKVEKFNVYSFPVVVKELADQYQLGSYVGASVDNPTKLIRFSVSPKGFNSMIFNEGQYEFIDPLNSDTTVYAVHAKTMPTQGKSFVCSTNESPAAVKDIEKLLEKGNSFSNQSANFAKSSDKKYRTMRLAMSVTGEYTQFHGGTVAGALAAINTTMTRVNFVFEKDFALHLNLQNFPGVIYTDGATDPYSDAAAGVAGAWNGELQTALTNNVGNANYDIGHLFGASGGGGNAGCIGCVCINPTATVTNGKGSGFTSPADGIPQGDNFDIDYVAHEMGHQLGGNHTFSHALEGSGVNVEPGSGSTIMGYAGITGANTDVQAHSDAYFHIASIKQIQANLIAKTCDVETTITNNPPVIAALPDYTIPKGTAFVLTASATDAENDPMTYTWEELDDAVVTVNRNNLGSTTTGSSFRSVAPSTSPTRYFPKFSSVLAGVLDNSSLTWESVSKVAKASKYVVTVRDNNQDPTKQQSQYAEQNITVGNDGPFRLAAQYADVNTPTPIQWVVANTTAAPYNVANVKIDYTTDNGTTWTVLSASTPNDGTENFTFPSSMNGQTIKVRISSIGNVFYAIGSVTLGPLQACSTAAPTNVVVSNITTSSASVSWMTYTGATYKVRYKKTSASVWTEVDTNVPSINLSNLSDGTAYEVQVALVCGTTVGTYSASVNFTTTTVAYCTASTQNGSIIYISKVALANISNTTAGSTYSNFTTNTALQVNLTKGVNNTIQVTIANPQYVAVAAYIDFNKDGLFDDSEAVLDTPVANLTGPVSDTFTVPNSALEGTPLRMRVVAFYAGSANNGLYLPSDYLCGLNFAYGEVEDYNVVVAPNPLATSDVAGPKDGIQIYPNPVSDVLNITKVSNKAAYKIYSAAGQLVKQGNITNGQINVTELIKGAYVISIEDKGKEAFSSKFIKK